MCLGGVPEADPGSAGEITSLGWLTNAKKCLEILLKKLEALAGETKVCMRAYLL